MKIITPVLLSCLLMACAAAPAFCQNEGIRAKADAVIAKAYESAAAEFPCKLKSGGKPKMLRWQGVAKCLNEAHDRVDWEEVSQQLRELRREYGLQASDIVAIAETCLSARALPYEKVFVVKPSKKLLLLPLSSSLLKFLPESSLQGLPVFDKSGEQVGTFAGVYSFEKAGEFSGKLDRHRLFQFTDSKGNVHGSPERLLLDQFGVPWNDAAAQPGFRLPSDRISVK